MRTPALHPRHHNLYVWLPAPSSFTCAVCEADHVAGTPVLAHADTDTLPERCVCGDCYVATIFPATPADE